MKDFVLIESFSDMMQAQLTKSLLEGSGIKVFLRSDNAGGIDTGLHASNGFELFVHKDAATDAAAILGKK